MAALQKEARAAAGLQERVSALQADLQAAQAEVAAAREQAALAASRSGVLEKAYAAAQEVGGASRGLRCKLACCSALFFRCLACLSSLQHGYMTSPLPCFVSLSPLQEAKALQFRQRQLQAVLDMAQMEARAAAGKEQRAADLAAELMQARQAAAETAQQLELARSRAAVLERTHATAAQVCALRGGSAGRCAAHFCQPALARAFGLEPAVH